MGNLSREDDLKYRRFRHKTALSDKERGEGRPDS